MATITRGAPSARARAFLTSRRFWLTTRLAVGSLVLLALIDRVGAGPFLHGLLSIDLRAIGAALAFGAVATAAAAWRWRIIAARLGVELAWSTAFALCYQSQFLNMVLPAGILGDVNRSVVQGRQSGNTGRSSRAVVMERTTGHAVQIGLTVLVVAGIGVEFEGYLLSSLGIGVGLLVGLGITAAAVNARVRSILLREWDELSTVLGSPAAVAQVVIMSIVAVACHVGTFVVAAICVGVDLPPLRLVSIALVVLLAASVPLNVGGWGPREGIAGWAFGLVGLGVTTGVTVSTLFGVLGLVAMVPGALSHFIIRRKNRDQPAVRDVEQRHLA